MNRLSRHKYFIFLLTLFIAVFYVFMTIKCETYLYLDGSNYFTNILAKQKYMLYPLGRYSFDYLTQFFTVALIKTGVRSADILGAAYGFGLTAWTAVFMIGASFLASYKNNKRIAYGLFLSETSVLMIWGSFPQQESIAGICLFLFIVVYALLYGREDKLIVHILAIVASALCYHMNEYFCAWSLVLAFIFLFRYFNEKKYSFFIWPILAIWHLFVAITSYLSISSRGEVPNIVETIHNIIAYKYMIIVLSLLVLVYMLSYFKTKMLSFFRLIISVIYILFNLIYIITRSHHIFNFGVASRFLILPMGICISVFFFAITHKEKTDYIAVSSIFVSVHCGLLLLLILFSYHMNYQFNTVLFNKMLQSEELFLRIDDVNDLTESDKLTYYYRPGFIGYHGEAVLAVRKEKIISTVLVNSDEWMSKGNVYKIGSYRNLEEYGIFFDKGYLNE